MMVMIKGNVMTYHLALYDLINAFAASLPLESDLMKLSKWYRNAFQVSNCIFLQFHKKAKLSPSQD